MDLKIFLFEFIAYVFFGLSMEVIFSVTGIEACLGKKLKKQTPHKYLEGFVSMYMIPVHGFGVLFGFKSLFFLIESWHISLRYMIWCLAFTTVEIIVAFIYQKTIGFYPWDYYKKSKFKIFKEGYSLWTLFPCWGIAGLILENYVSLIQKLVKVIETL